MKLNLIIVRYQLGVNQAYPKLNICMEVYEKDELIYSIILDINGNYYCWGSVNFEFDIVKKSIIKDCKHNLLKDIHHEL